MAYEPKEWVCGETITADALNHIEEGIEECCGGASGVVLEVVETRDATAEELEVQGCGDGVTTVYNLTGAELFNAINSGACISKAEKTQVSGGTAISRYSPFQISAGYAEGFGYEFELYFDSQSDEYISLGENSPVIRVECRGV